MKFGDAVENICASKSNPQREGLFVRKFKRQGRLNHGWYIEVTDGRGNFWLVGADSVKPLEAGGDER